ncbi:hypothetical protein MNBD_GAMMA20-1754 [hydrothermal vent metagenome]|uniref:Uncharacterized protein n=1 Tax=hydrothermal vent metagenome TaxID=652676 RepID=A0A3B1AAY6_9ZZZZ
MAMEHTVTVKLLNIMAYTWPLWAELYEGVCSNARIDPASHHKPSLVMNHVVIIRLTHPIGVATVKNINALVPTFTATMPAPALKAKLLDSPFPVAIRFVLIVYITNTTAHIDKYQTIA